MLNPIMMYNTPQYIDSKKIGWIRPDGVIQFQSEESAKSYAVNRVVSPLNTDAPFERAVIIDKNKILGEHDGSAERCAIPKYKGKDLVVYHGHPDFYAHGATTPISITDSKLLDYFISEVRAYNALGEYSSIKKIELPSDEVTVSISNKGIKKAIKPKSFSSPVSSRLKEDLLKSSEEKTKVNISKRFSNPRSNLSQLLKEYYKAIFTPEIRRKIKNAILTNNVELLEQIEKEFLNNLSEKDCQNIHEFWVNNAEKFNLEYSTNYSNVK